MMLRGLLALCVLVWAVGLVGVLLAPEPAGAESRESTPALAERLAAEVAEPLDRQLVGFTINLHRPTDIAETLTAVDAVADLGANTLQLTVPVFQDHGSSDGPRRIERIGKSPSRDQMLAVLGHAKQRGLKTILLWQINFENPRGNEWRGKIQPPDWDRWWEDYRALLEFHARVAAQAEADVLVIGCELLSTHQAEYRRHWLEAAELARTHFGGRLVYSSTWDSFHSYPAWDALDLVGVSGWWNLTRNAVDADHPTDAELDARWAEIRASLADFSSRAGRPLLITEVGYPSIPWALRDPWNYIPKSDTKPDGQAQAKGYESFLRGWQGVIAPGTHASAATNTNPSQWAGVLFYEWQPWGEPGGPDDYGYAVRNKPAEALLRQWFKPAMPRASPPNPTAAPDATAPTAPDTRPATLPGHGQG
ncbi:MAG: hypothetical protein AAF288_00810 [Planctomycetota bacterium]